ncbi:trypsin-like peptidase domain-containing protein [Lysobacter sp. MMG2]|uniref:trypsin-like serine peptidase n=1 Tax=Lysobacter sp. MMG2 TaxID=2801338 RepID=UPI001C24A207|nr:trypsin-like peptidase domain-containing protein [Lysobacter sp. MMG2]MBU8975848.1 trypsin-like peptidase domain-containing protein [Lysobacter sp. MMG2]
MDDTDEALRSLLAEAEAGDALTRRRRAAHTAGNAGAASTHARDGSVRKYVVIGHDDRWAVDALRAYPYRCIFRLSIRWPGGDTEGGTAFLVGPRTLLTAAHCVCRPGHGPGEVSVTGAGGNTYRAGSATWPRAWQDRGDDGSDVACIQLTSDPGTSLGHFGTRSLTSSEAENTFALAGYPVSRGAGLYAASGSIQGLDPVLVHHTIDTGGGQSGSPVFSMINGVAMAVGIHLLGANPHNRALRLTAEKIDQIRRWIG